MPLSYWKKLYILLQAIAVIYPISQTILKFQTPSPWFSDETQDIF